MSRTSRNLFRRCSATGRPQGGRGVEPDDIDDLARRAKAGDGDGLEALLNVATKID